jgi:DNA-binding beta-propeller fold protein YncE
MRTPFPRARRQWAVVSVLAISLLLLLPLAQASGAGTETKHLLYVATPGIRDYLEYGGHGVLVFDIDHGHRFVKRIPSAGLNTNAQPMNVKGICAHAGRQRLYVSTIKTLMCFDLVSDRLLWEKSYEGGCDRMSMTPDGSMLFLPSLEQGHWHVVGAETGEVLARITPESGAHNTIVGPDGREAYLAGLKSPLLTVADVRTRQSSRTVGPFSAPVRPFTVNGAQTLCYVNVNELLGFEVGDLKTGRKLHRVEVEGFKQGPVKRHGCPSHGIGLTPDGSELWLADAANERIHVFDNTVMPPKQVVSIRLRDQPGWITFSIDGRYAYPSTGDVIEVKSRKIVTGLKDEAGREVQSEKLLEIDFAGERPVQAGNQFGISHTTAPSGH